MAAADGATRSGVSRRDALRILAASSTTVAAGSLIVSQPAHADSGSATCRFDFAEPGPQATVRIINQSGNRRDFLSISVSNVNGGNCPCDPGSRPTIEYAYWIIIPGTGSGGTGWIGSSAVSVSSPQTLWGNQGGSVTVAVGVRATCPTPSGTAVRCRFASATFTVTGPNSSTTQGFTLATDNGNSNPPTGLPSCALAAPLLRSAPFLRSSGGLVVTEGAVAPPPFDPKAGDDTTDLGVPPAEPATTTTTEPPPPTDPTTTTSTTSTTSSTTSTTTSSTSTTSTTTPAD